MPKYHGSHYYLGAWHYVLLDILYAIPVIGLICLLVHSFSANNENRRHYARSYFARLLLIIVIGAIATGIFFLAGGPEAYLNKFAEKTESPQNTQLDALRSPIVWKNYLLDSGTEYTSSEYLVHRYSISEPMAEGDQYTISMSVTPGAGVTQYSVKTSNGYNELCKLDVSGTGTQVVSGTFTASYFAGRTPADDPTNARVLVFRLPKEGDSIGDTTIHWIKLERGSVATDYVPAPEDSK